MRQCNNISRHNRTFSFSFLPWSQFGIGLSFRPGWGRRGEVLEHRSQQSSSAQKGDSAQEIDLAQQTGSYRQGESLVPVRQLVEPGPVRLRRYLTECERGERQPADLDLILEVAEHRASDEGSLDWAEIAVRTANLAAAGNPTRRHSYLYRAMLVRTLFITRTGSQPGHPILDPAAVIDWFHAELKFSPAEARELSERWKDPHFQQEFATELETHNGSAAGVDGEPQHISDTLNELLDLQLLKYRLQLLRRLAECGELPATPAVTEWLQTARFLP